MQDKLDDERAKLADEKDYSKRVRSERESLKAEVQKSKADLHILKRRYQEQALTIQSLERQLESRKRGRESEENQNRKGVTAALQSRVEKRFRSLIGDMDEIFKESGIVFDPAATDEEDDEPVEVAPVESTADAAKTTAAEGAEVEKLTATKAAAPEIEDTEGAQEHAKKNEDAKEHPTLLPVCATLDGSSSDSSSSASEHGE